eukprot:scaffold7695_cov124-Isochrysis_galbana.AAC.12
MPRLETATEARRPNTNRTEQKTAHKVVQEVASRRAGRPRHGRARLCPSPPPRPQGAKPRAEAAGDP